MDHAQRLSVTEVDLRRAAQCLAFVALLLLALSSAVASWHLSCLPGGEGLCSLDFYVFWTESGALRNSLSPDVYSPGDAARLGSYFSDLAASSGDSRMLQAAALFPTLQPVSTPLLFSVFSLWTGSSFEHDAMAFFGASVCCYFAVLGYLTRIHSVALLPAAAVSVAAFFPLSQVSVDLQAGNVNGIQLALFCSAVAAARAPRSRQSSVLVGALLAAATLFKPNLATVPALYMLHLARQRRMGEALHVVAGGLAASIGAELFVSATWPHATPWATWIDAMRTFLLSPRPATHSNSSLASLVGDAVGHSSTSATLLPLLLLCLGALAVLRIPTQPLRSAANQLTSRNIDTLVLYAGVAAGVVCSKPMWTHYLALLVPCALEAMFPLADSRLGSPVFRRLGAILTLAVPVISLPFLGTAVGFPFSTATVAWSHALYALSAYGLMLIRLSGPALAPTRPLR